MWNLVVMNWKPKSLIVWGILKKSTCFALPCNGDGTWELKFNIPFACAHPTNLATFNFSFISIHMHFCAPLYIYIYHHISVIMCDHHFYTSIFHKIHKKTTDNGNNSIHSIPPVTVTSRTTPWAPSASSPWSAKGALAVSTKPVIYDQAAVGSVGWNMLEGQHVCLAHWYLGIVDKNNLDEIVRWVVSLIDNHVKVPYKFP